MLESLKVALVLLLDLPIFELASAGTIRTLSLSDTLTDSGANLITWLCSCIQVGWQWLGPLSLGDLGNEAGNLKLSRSTILGEGRTRLEQLLDLRIGKSNSELLQSSLELNLVQFTLSSSIILAQLGLQIETLVTNRFGESAKFDLLFSLLGQLEQLGMEVRDNDEAIVVGVTVGQQELELTWLQSLNTLGVND